MTEYQVGDVIEVEVSGFTNYGIFVTADHNYKGLIHIKEVSSRYVKNLKDYVTMNEHILCEVLEVNKESHRLRLSIKNINYKLTPKYGKIKDTPDGFKALQMHLPIWIREKLKEINS